MPILRRLGLRVSPCAFWYCFNGKPLFFAERCVGQGGHLLPTRRISEGSLKRVGMNAHPTGIGVACFPCAFWYCFNGKPLFFAERCVGQGGHLLPTRCISEGQPETTGIGVACFQAALCADAEGGQCGGCGCLAALDGGFQRGGIARVQPVAGQMDVCCRQV